MTIRRARPDEGAEIQRVFRAAVLAVDRRHYTAEELADWAACGNEPKWREKIDRQAFFVAQNKESQLVGFASITPTGDLDLLYVDPAVQGQGVGAELLNTVENQAKEFGCKDSTSEVSLPALPFFLHHGYRIEREQKRTARTVALTNFLMSKEL